MQNKFTSERELLESIKKVSLTSQEKSAVKNSILSHMDSNPILSNVLVQKDKKRTVYDFFAYQSLYLVPLALFFILILNREDGLVQNKNLPSGSTAPEEINLDNSVQTFSTVSTQNNLQVELTDVKAQPEPPKATRQVGNFSAQTSTTSQVMLMKSSTKTEVATSTDNKKTEIKKETTTDKIIKQIDGGYKAIIETIFGKSKKEIRQEIVKEKRAKKTAKVKEVKNQKIENAKKSVKEPIQVKESNSEIIIQSNASTTSTSTPETISTTSPVQINVEVSI